MEERATRCSWPPRAGDARLSACTSAVRSASLKPTVLHSRAALGLSPQRPGSTALDLARPAPLSSSPPLAHCCGTRTPLQPLERQGGLDSDCITPTQIERRVDCVRFAVRCSSTLALLPTHPARPSSLRRSNAALQSTSSTSATTYLRCAAAHRPSKRAAQPSGSLSRGSATLEPAPRPAVCALSNQRCSTASRRSSIRRTRTRCAALRAVSAPSPSCGGLERSRSSLLCCCSAGSPRRFGSKRTYCRGIEHGDRGARVPAMDKSGSGERTRRAEEASGEERSRSFQGELRRRMKLSSVQ